MQSVFRSSILYVSVLPLFWGIAHAHDPVFGTGPHVLYKGGVEVAVEAAHDKTGGETETELGLELAYGITGDWAAGVELPYANKKESGASSQGASDIQLFTKYRFWRKDALGKQTSAAVLLGVNLQNADETADPPLGNGATDVMAGLTYGFESIKWYRWAGLRYIKPGENDAGIQLGDQWRVDLAGGWRPTPPDYKKPDTVWLLEINGETAERTTINGNPIAGSGGTQWFISPGIFWTQRNFAVKAGLQIPINSDLNGTQETADYRSRLVLEWHL